jgi:thiol-disulfide isomerase/thioredoxin
MQKFAKNLLLMGLLLFAAACGSDASFTVEGTNDEASEVIVYKLLGDDFETIDTLALDDDGKFVFEGTVEGPAILFFSFDDGRRVPIILDGKKAKIKFVVDDPKGYGVYKISGSKESERLQILQNFAEHAFTVIDSLDQLIADAQDLGDTVVQEVRAGADQVFLDLMADYKKKLERFVDEDSTSLSNLFVFNQRVGNMPILDISEGDAYFDKVARNLSAIYPDEPNVALFTRNLEQYKQQAIRERLINEAKINLADGNPAPEIALEDANGTTRKLSDLKGKVVLIDFWASWCQPCRMENPNLVRMYNQYKAKGFDVFSVSLDGVERQMDPRQEWLDAIAADNLAWDNHVSDLKGWNTPLLESYGFTGIPFTVLVDRDGTIIAKNLRGAQLEEKLKEVLK